MSRTHKNGPQNCCCARFKEQVGLTFWLFKLVNEILDRVFGLVDDQALHHVFKDLIETLLFDVLFTASLEVNLLLFQHHLALIVPVKVFKLITSH